MLHSTVGIPPTPIKIGAVEVYPLVEIFNTEMDPLQFFSGLAREQIDSDLWCFQTPFWDEQREIPVITIQSFLVKTPNTLILVDAGVGNNKHRTRPDFNQRESNWLDQISAVGHKPEDVELVIFTHLHPDHVGWATRWVEGKRVPTFPNAHYLVSGTEFEFWTTSPGAAPMLATGDFLQDSIFPLQEFNQLKMVEDYADLPAEISVVDLSGHTPGSLGVAIESAGLRAVITGDTFHHALQCAYPDVNSRFCAQTDGSARRRRSFLQSVADTDTMVIPTHFPPPTVGFFTAHGDGFRFNYVED